MSLRAAANVDKHENRPKVDSEEARAKCTMLSALTAASPPKCRLNRVRIGRYTAGNASRPGDLPAACFSKKKSGGQSGLSSVFTLKTHFALICPRPARFETLTGGRGSIFIQKILVPERLKTKTGIARFSLRTAAVARYPHFYPHKGGSWSELLTVLSTLSTDKSGSKAREQQRI